MAKTDFTTGASGQSVHGRTTAGSDKTQAVVIGIDGSDAVPPVDATFGVGTTDAGTYGYDAGTAAQTVDVPSGARLKRVSVLAGGSAATITIGGGATITVPAGADFDEQIPGVALGADVVIAGSVATFYVSWVA